MHYNGEMNKRIVLQHEVSTMFDYGDYEKYKDKKFYLIKVGSRRYAACHSNGVRYYLHRLIMNAKSGEYTDHINRDGLDNRSSNLRLCTNSENLVNSTKKNRNQTSKYKGVCWHKVGKKWQAKACGIYLGLFVSEKEAALAYDEYMSKHFEEFAQFNFH